MPGSIEGVFPFLSAQVYNIAKKYKALYVATGWNVTLKYLIQGTASLAVSEDVSLWVTAGGSRILTCTYTHHHLNTVMEALN